MDEYEITGKNKQMKIDTDGLYKNLSTRVHPEACHLMRGEPLQESQAEVTVMRDNSDPSDDGQNRCPAATPSLDSSSLRTEEGAYCFLNGMKSHSETNEFFKEENNPQSNKERIHRLSDEPRNSKDSSNLKEKSVLLESVDKQDSTEVGGEEQPYVPSSKYNFDNPVMAINYIGEFKTSKENFTKGCKWLVDT